MKEIENDSLDEEEEEEEDEERESVDDQNDNVDRHLVINVEETKRNDNNNINREERLKLMQQKIRASPTLLTKSAGNSSCCIFRVPQTYKEINGRAYQPHIVSIGPLHHGDPHLQMIEQHKWRYLGSLLSRIKVKNVSLQDLLNEIEALEAQARECYSECIFLDRHEFVEMMVLDGCFLIELFRKVGNVAEFEDDDPIITMSWIAAFLCRDLLRLENQLPFFVLERLFDLTRTYEEEESQVSLLVLALSFFNYAMQRPDDVITRQRGIKGRHLLDLVRTSYIEFDQVQHANTEVTPTPTHIIHCVSKLRRSGIQLKETKNHETFLVVKFRGGVIEMPALTIDDFMSSLLLNCVAYEQCHSNCSKHFTTYATFLDCLINTSRDVEYLSDRNIIENYFGTDAEVAHFINNLGKEVAFDIETCYLSKLFNQVHEYYTSSWHVQWASFKYTYFETPWSFMSALAALVLLALTMLQTFYTVYDAYK